MAASNATAALLLLLCLNFVDTVRSFLSTKAPLSSNHGSTVPSTSTHVWFRISKADKMEHGTGISMSTEDTSPVEGTARTPAGFGSRSSRRARGATKKRKTGSADETRAAPVIVLKRSTRWACVKNCGACCYLAPDERPDLAEYLPDPAELELYKSMTLEDGWCKHFDRDNRACTIYDDRPRFCRVETETFGDMYGVDAEDMDEFCSSCCKEQINDVYGSKSNEMKVFKSALAALARGERPIPEPSPFASSGCDGQKSTGNPPLKGSTKDSRIRHW